MSPNDRWGWDPDDFKVTLVPGVELLPDEPRPDDGLTERALKLKGSARAAALDAIDAGEFAEARALLEQGGV